jgi:hypothetical protein
MPASAQSALLQHVLAAMQVPEQSAVPAGQAQLPPGAAQAIPPWQSAPSQQVATSMQVPLQLRCPPGQFPQLPAWHWAPPWQSAFEQQPVAATQLLPQSRRVEGQMQVPTRQTFPPGHSESAVHGGGHDELAQGSDCGRQNPCGSHFSLGPQSASDWHPRTSHAPWRHTAPEGQSMFEQASLLRRHTPSGAQVSPALQSAWLWHPTTSQALPRQTVPAAQFPQPPVEPGPLPEPPVLELPAPELAPTLEPCPATEALHDARTRSPTQASRRMCSPESWPPANGPA